MTKSIQTLGVVGGNLLASMICMEAKKRGIQTLLLEPEVANIATEAADKHLVSEINRQTIERLALKTDAVVFTTSEIPIIPQSMGDTYTFLPSNQGIDFVANRVEQLTYAALADVPTPSFYHSNNKLEFLKQLANVQLPCKVYQMYDIGHEVIEIEDANDLEAFLYELDDKAVEWVVEEITEYERFLSLSVIKKAGKIYQYPIQEEFLKGDIKSVTIPAAITKTMTQKIVRYTKKLLQEVETEGLFALKFGMKKNKSIELMYVNPGITVGDLATVHYADLSIYEQVLNLLEGEPVKEGVLTSDCQVIALEQDDLQNKPSFPYHKYKFDKYNKRPIDLYVKRIQKDDMQ